MQAYADSRSLIASLARIAGPDAPYGFFEAARCRAGAARRPGYVVDQALAPLGFSGLADLEASWRDGR